MTGLDLKIWNARWDSLDASMQTLKSQIDASSVARKETLGNLLTCLQEFAKSQYNFFSTGLTSKLESSADYPLEYVLRTTLDQIAFDLNVIQRAFHQRILDYNSTHAIATLAKADMLAYKALEPAIKAGFLRNTTAVTYFQKQAAIRVIPYGQAALVGIPFTSIHASNNESNVRDLLAIPHEVGHYLFWHGRKSSDRVKAKSLGRASADSNWLSRWLEEIFADVYGCLVAGPVLALDFQELQIDGPPDEFVKNDGEHPVPALRPYIYTDVLRKMDHPKAADSLDHLWASKLQEHGNPKSFKRSNPISEQCPEIDLTVARGQINDLVAKLVDHLDFLLPGKRDTENPIWTPDLAEPLPEPVADFLYGEFKKYLDTIDSAITGTPTKPAKKMPELRIVDPNRMPPQPEDKDHVRVNKEDVGKTEEWIDTLKQTTSDPERKMPPEVWSLVLSMSGWATGGPEGEQVPKG